MTAKPKRKKLEEAAPLPVLLDLGAGKNVREGFVGVDIMKGSNIECDLFKTPWHWKDDSIDGINCSHFLEHVPDMIAFMNECHRIMKQGAQMMVVSPYYSSIRCWQDPTHKNAISEVSFLYYNKAWREQNSLEHYPITADFDFTFGYAFDPYWAAKSQEARDFALKFYINVVSDIQVVLVKK